MSKFNYAVALAAAAALATGGAAFAKPPAKSTTQVIDTTVVDVTLKDGKQVDKLSAGVKAPGTVNTKLKVQDNPAQTKLKVQEPGLIKGSAKLKTPK